MRAQHTFLPTLAATALGLALFSSGCGEPPQADSPRQAPPAEVAVHVVQASAVALTTELPGRVSASTVAEVRPQVGGIVQKRLFTEGADVRAGQVLYQIDPSTYQTAYDNAKAVVATAQAQQASARAAQSRAKAGYASALAAQRGAEANHTLTVAAHAAALTGLTSARAALTRTEASAVPARLRVERFRDVIAARAIAQQELDDASSAAQQAEAEVDRAKAAVQGAEAEIARAEAAIGVAQAGIGSATAALQSAQAEMEAADAAVQVAQAGIQSAEAGLEAARINLGYTRVTAPVAGRIGRSAVTEGALVAPYQPLALATIQQLDPVYVDVTQSTADLLRLRRRVQTGELTKGGAGQAEVGLLLEDDSAYPQRGTFGFADVTVDPTTGSVTLRTVFPNPQAVLLPGMFVRAVVNEGAKEGAILVPQQAVSRDPKGNPFALVVDGEGRAQVRRLTLDRALGDQWLVSGGLAPGERVVVEGTQRVRPGAPVRAVPAASSTPQPN